MGMWRIESEGNFTFGLCISKVIWCEVIAFPLIYLDSKSFKKSSLRKTDVVSPSCVLARILQSLIWTYIFIEYNANV